MKFFSIFVFCSSLLLSISITITPQQLNASVAKKFPIEQTVFFAKLVVENPEVTITKKSEKIHFSADVYSPNIVLNNGKTAVFRVFATVYIRYSASSIFFENIQIEKIQNKDLDQNLEFKLKQGLQLFLNAYFSQHPVYTFANNYTGQMLGGMIKNIRVKNGNIEVILG